MKFKVDKEKCVGCGTCVQLSDGGTKLGSDMKAEVVDNGKIERAGGENICPFRAIKMTGQPEKRKRSKKE